MEDNQNLVLFFRCSSHRFLKYYILIVAIILSINLTGQNLTEEELNYKPKDFNEAVAQLEIVFPDSTKSAIKEMSEDEFMSIAHRSTGRWIRNEWLYNRYLFGLIVTDSDLKKDLESKGLFTNDDMSSVILQSFYRKLTNKKILLEQQIEDIYQWYENIDNPEWIAKQDSISWAKFMTQFEIGDTLSNTVYYDRDWLGKPRKNVVVLAEVIEIADRSLKIDLISFGGETNKALIYNEIQIDSTDCWLKPSLIYQWKKISEQK